MVHTLPDDVDEVWLNDELNLANERAVAEKTAERVDFQLTYGRAPNERRFTAEELENDPIDDAYNPGERSAGTWTIGDRPLSVAENTEEWWINTFAEAAIQEAVHEALEWFRVDGEVWLDPHGPNEGVIMQEVNKMVKKLIAARMNRVVHT